MSIKNGATVRLVQPVIEGQVQERRINQATDEVELRVEWQENGEPVSSWFTEAQLQEVPQ